MSVYNLNHLEGTMVGERMQKQKSEFFPGNLEEPSDSLGLHLICSYCLPILISLIQQQTCCYKDVRMAKPGNEGLFSAEAEWTSPTCATICMDSIASAFAWKSARASPWYSGSVLLVWVSILITAISEGEQNSSKKIIYCCPFLVGVPEDARKPLCFHNIPKSWAYWLSVLILTVCPSDNWHAQVRARGKQILAVGVYRDAEKGWTKFYNSEPFWIWRNWWQKGVQVWNNW